MTGYLQIIINLFVCVDSIILFTLGMKFLCIFLYKCILLFFRWDYLWMCVCSVTSTNERIAIRGFTSYMSLCIKANCSAPSGGDDQHYLSSFIQYTKMTFSVIFFTSYCFFSTYRFSIPFRKQFMSYLTVLLHKIWYMIHVLVCVIM